MEDKKLNEQESLALIARMIQNTQHRMERNMGTPFLVWGYTTVILSVSIALLLQFSGNLQWQWLWFLLPAIGWSVTTKLGGYRTKGVVTFVDKMIGYVWLVCGITGFAISTASVVMSMCSSSRLQLPVFF